MNTQRLAVALTAINLMVVLHNLAQAVPSTAQTAASVLRGRALEIVDDRGQVRSRLNVSPDGEVVFRLMGEKGTIRVKLGASEAGSGLVLADEATEPGVHIIARRTATAARPKTTSLTLTGADGRHRVIRP